MSFDSDQMNPITRLLRSILNYREVHNIQDVIEAIHSVIQMSEFLCVVFQQRKSVPDSHQGDLITNRLLFNHISFALDNGQIVRFQNREDISKFVTTLDAEKRLEIAETEICKIYFSNSISIEKIREIERLCTTFFATSDISLHYIENTARRVARQIFPFREQIHELPEIAKFVARQFHVDVVFASVRSPLDINLDNAVYNDFYFQFVHGDISSFLQETRFIKDIAASIRAGNEYSGRISVAREKVYYKLIPVSMPGRIFNIGSARNLRGQKSDVKFYPVGALAILSRDTRIDRLCIGTAKELVREISGTKKIAEQLRSINDLHAELLDARDHLLKTPFSSQSDAIQEFSKYAKTVTSSIVALTAAHSATVRIFDPFRSALRPVASAFAETLSKESKTTDELRIMKGSASANVFIFSATDRDVLYIPNIDEIDAELLERGLSIHVTRQETKSELCIRLSKNTVPIGTLNIEAPYAYALGKELVYCQALARLLTDFYDVALKTSDSGWLPKISMSHIVYHRIQKIRRDHPELTQILNFIANPIQIANKPGYEEAHDRLTDIINGLNSGIAGISDKQFRKLVRNNIPDDILIRGETASSIAIILETLIENCRIHANVDKDEIEISLVTGAGQPVKELQEDAGVQLQISYKARIARQNLDLLDRLTISPVWEDEDQTYHFGMFLVGAHARLLGGVTYVDTDPLPGRDSRPVRVIINLPLAPLAAHYELSE